MYSMILSLLKSEFWKSKEETTNSGFLWETGPGKEEEKKVLLSMYNFLYC